jgi:S-adenosylmethionine synthetase
MNIVIERLSRMPIEKQRVEMVERKGVGHPDSLADGMAESVSRALSKEYLKRYGVILHHNTDKLEVVGGEAKAWFGGGEVIRPIFILLSGRATTHVKDEEIPVHEVAIKAAHDYIRSVLPDLPKDAIEFDSKIGQGSTDLREVFARKDSIPSANDTSFGVGFAPLSETEHIVFKTERFLNSKEFKKKYPELGPDIKVMGLRYNNRIIVTVAGAFVSKYIPDFDHYVNVKEEIMEKIKDMVSKEAEREIELHFNTADNYDKKVVYLTLTGTSAEAGDDGAVGRGNRINGLITPNREMSLEAAAGKNPVNHIGKLYNIVSKHIAEKVHDITQKEVYVKILAQIGKPITDPLMVNVEIAGENNKTGEIESIIREELSKITEIKERILDNGIDVF